VCELVSVCLCVSVCVCVCLCMRLCACVSVCVSFSDEMHALVFKLAYLMCDISFCAYPCICVYVFVCTWCTCVPTADPAKLTSRVYNITGVSFTPAQQVESIRKVMPDFKIEYKPDFRQAIADSWPKRCV
jgi:hypothetical protein